MFLYHIEGGEKPLIYLNIHHLKFFMEATEIRAAREALGLTVQDVSKKLGAPYSAVHRWEKGENRPSAKYVAALRDLFDGKQTAVEKSEVDFLKQRIADLETQLEDQREIINVFKAALETIAKK
tara:strand:- start:1225 stop:1596 length:372 start_codon:yes stop_codon:yes gene_type:complete